MDYMGTSPPIAQKLRVCAEICQGMAYLHGHGIVHGDLKPANVMLTEVHQVCIPLQHLNTNATYTTAESYNTATSHVPLQHM